MARPTVLTDQVIDDLAQAIETGMPYEQAFRRTDIDKAFSEDVEAWEL